MTMPSDASLSKQEKPKKGERLLSQRQAVQICVLDDKAISILEKTTFKSQPSYNWRRAVRMSNVINDFFEAKDFKGKRILELGPGHYAFALIARHLGAEVVCIEREPAFIKLGRYLGFEVWAKDFEEINSDNTNERFDGIWIKGTFNSCNYNKEKDIEGFVKRFTSLLKPEAWRWCVTINKSYDGSNESFVDHRIEIQRQAFQKLDWQVDKINETDRKRYALNYSGCYYYFTRNLDFLSDSQVEQERSVQDASDLSVSAKNMFNKVSKIWKPTIEYYENPWQYYVDFINLLQRKGARFITMSMALDGNYNPRKVNIILDHHIDFYPLETEAMCKWELEKGVVSNIYLFNSFDYNDTSQKKLWKLEDLNIPFYQHLEQCGFEIGYHQNAVGQARKNNFERDYTKDLDEEIKDKAKEHFSYDIDCLRKYFNIRTMIPHGAGEGNNQLMDFPEGYEDIVWVYNNTRHNKTCLPPIKWNNFSDSCSINSQRIRTDGATYIVNVDNLHVFAKLTKRGLNHALIHPGRFSKGMPYDDSYNATPSVVSNEFEGINEKSLPLVVPDIVKRWEGQKGTENREKDWMNQSGSYKIKKQKNKFYLLTNSIEALNNYMAINERVVPFFLIPERITTADKEKYKVPRPVTKTMRLPPQPSDAVFESKDSTNQQFFEQFRGLYNIIYSDSVLKYIGKSNIFFEALHLVDIDISNKKDFKLLRDVLLKYARKCKLFMRIRLKDIPLNEHKEILKSFQGLRAIKCNYHVAYGQMETMDDCCQSQMVEIANHEKNYSLLHSLKQKILKTKRKAARECREISQNECKKTSSSDEEKILLLSNIRDESAEATLNRFTMEEILSCPRRFSIHLKNLMILEIDSAGVNHGLAHLTLPNGRIFFGQISQPNHKRAYYYVRDLLPKQLDEDTFLLGLDIVHRYTSDYTWLPEDILPGKGGTIVEAGAYIGHKALRFVDKIIGTEGKLLAIEMMPENVEILRKNVIENELEATVEVLGAGVWKEKSEMKVYGKSRQRNTLVHLEKLKDDTVVMVPVFSLDEILENWGQRTIDLLYITLNGAEIEALQGLNNKLDTVKIIFVTAPYTNGDVRNYDIALKLLKEKGCHVLHTRGSSIIAVTPRYKDEFI